jgi:hypothetical protein
MSDPCTKEHQLDNQEDALTDLSKLLDTTVAAMIPVIPLDGRFRNDHRFMIELYIKTLFTFKKAQRVIFVGKEIFNEHDLYAYHCALNRGLEEIDELYEHTNDPKYFPKEITAALLTFLKEYGYEKFYLSEGALSTIP